MGFSLTVQVPQGVLDRFRPRGERQSQVVVVPLDLFSQFTMRVLDAPIPIEDGVVMNELRYMASRYQCRCGQDFAWWSAGLGDATKPTCPACGAK